MLTKLFGGLVLLLTIALAFAVQAIEANKLKLSSAEESRIHVEAELAKSQALNIDLQLTYDSTVATLNAVINAKAESNKRLKNDLVALRNMPNDEPQCLDHDMPDNLVSWLQSIPAEGGNSGAEDSSIPSRGANR